MNGCKALSAMAVLVSIFYSCRKEPAVEQQSASAGYSIAQSSAVTVAGGSSHERFDQVPLDLNWTIQYKPDANAYKIVQDMPAAGPGTAKFILYPDAVISGKNRSQLVYQPNHPLGTESSYSFFMRIPKYWPDRAANNDVMLATWNASPDPAKGQTWSNMPINEPLAQIRYHAEAGKSYLQLWQGLNTSTTFEGKIWKQTMIAQLPIVKESWNKLTLKIKWSTANDGYVTGLVNDKPWVSKTSVRTMANAVPAYFNVGLARPVQANIPENVISYFVDELNISLVEPNQIVPKVIARNLKNPWEIAWGADNYIWLTERPGIISRLNPATGAITRLLTIADCKQVGTGGLLGMALHPQFMQQPFVYVLYDYDKAGKPTQKLVRYRYSGGVLGSPTIILDNLSSGITEHHGTRLLIVDNYLFITTGDAGGGADGMNAQNLNSLNGKVLRINLDGSIPPTNMKLGSAVWSYGFRNSQGMVFANNKLYASEHGPDSDDEVNIIEKGRNYGWPTVLGYCDNSAETNFCSAQNVRQPLKAWTPTIAPSGIDYYGNTGPITPWRNSLLMCTLKNSRLMQLKLNTDGSAITETREFLTNAYGRLRDICISPQGKVYVCTDNGTDDKIVEISAP